MAYLYTFRTTRQMSRQRTSPSSVDTTSVWCSSTVLFVTAAMTHDEATQCIERCAMSLAVKVFLITPVVAFAKAGFSLALAISDLSPSGGAAQSNFDFAMT
eukprot:PhM_4_TR6299/c6_g5_i2/m.41965